MHAACADAKANRAAVQTPRAERHARPTDTSQPALVDSLDMTHASCDSRSGTRGTTPPKAEPPSRGDALTGRGLRATPGAGYGIQTRDVQLGKPSPEPDPLPWTGWLCGLSRLSLSWVVATLEVCRTHAAERRVPSPLIVKDLDVVEELLLAEMDRIKGLSQLELRRREPAFHRRVVEAVAPAAHTALDVMAIEQSPVVLARVRRASV